uniref:2-5A-dependent ribonuclease-like isoform X3 n=1 Tax=Pristiophorus japonicus TaxID=55135 RepID=UPI00398E41A8
MADTLDVTALGKKLRDLCQSNKPDRTQVEGLIKDGALLNSDAGGVALCFAASKGHEDIAELLLKNKANVNYQTVDSGWTPLLNAVQSDHENIVHLLLKHEADPHLRKRNGATPFIIAAIGGNVSLLQTFLSLGADVNETDVNGFTAFMEAAQYGNEDALRFLFEKNADVNKHREVCDTKKNLTLGGKTALMDAVVKGHEDIVKILLGKMNADVNAVDNLGRTALIHALQKDSQAIVETLLYHEADVNSINKNQSTPLSTALTKSPLNIHVVEMLMKRGANLNVPDNDGKTPLILAVEKKNKEVVKLLLEGASVEINAQDKSGRTALLAAVESKNALLTEMLCKKGADVYCEDNRGNTPLLVARRNYDNKTKKVLIDYGAEKIKPNVRAPSKWKEISERWHGALEKLQRVERSPIGKMKLSRMEDFKITGNNTTEVCLGFYENDTEVAVKCHRRFSEEAKKEKQCLTDPKIRESNLFVKHVACVEDESCHYICLDLCEYNLEECVDRWPDTIRTEAPEIMKRLVLALQILHGAKFAHRDLHPTNVLRDVEKQVRLADFDKSVHFGDNAAVTIPSPGTWESSEILQKLKGSSTATFEEDELFKADLQALGQLLHHITTGGKNPYRSEEDVCENNPSLDEDLRKPENAEVRHLIERLLAPAEQRATLSEVKGHPFLWTKTEKNQFVQSLANEEDVTRRKQDSLLVQILNKTSEDEKRSFHNWKEKIDCDVLNNMKMGQRKKVNENAYNNTTSDLLKFIRNLSQHFNEKPEEIQTIVVHPEKYCFGLFPDLVISVYNAVKDTKGMTAGDPCTYLPCTALPAGLPFPIWLWTLYLR